MKMLNDLQREDLAILFIVSSDYASLKEKGVASMILERDEGGFFKKVFNVHPYASKTETLDLNETHRLIEFGRDYPFSFLNSNLGKKVNYLFKPFWIVKALISLVKTEHIDMIRATDPFWCGFYAWMVSRLTGIPFCVSIHADYDRRYRLDGRAGGTPRLFKVIESFVLPRAHLVMPIREHLIKKIIERGVDQQNIRVIPHGISIRDFMRVDDEDIKKNLGIPSNKKILSFVGRLARDNYVYDLIELARRLSETRSDFVILLVGDGFERGRLEELVRKYHLSSLVLFPGFQPKERVISIRRQSLIALCLMGGFSLMEACATGCPIISYNVEWHYELVKNGETGFLVKENDLEALTQAVAYLLDHPSEAEEMGVRAQKLAFSRNNISKTSEMKKNYYRELLQYRVS